MNGVAALEFRPIPEAGSIGHAQELYEQTLVKEAIPGFTISDQCATTDEVIDMILDSLGDESVIQEGWPMPVVVDNSEKSTKPGNIHFDGSMWDEPTPIVASTSAGSGPLWLANFGAFFTRDAPNPPPDRVIDKMNRLIRRESCTDTELMEPVMYVGRTVPGVKVIFRANMRPSWHGFGTDENVHRTNNIYYLQDRV